MKSRNYIKRPLSRRPNSWSVPALCQAYSWPQGLKGGGVIAIIELGGGWIDSDVTQFCARYNVPHPSVTDVSVDGTENSPTGDPGANGEVALDIQVAAAAYSEATGQPALIRVYWTQSIAAGVQQAALDGCDVCSISWGAPENEWSFAEKEALKAAMVIANAAKMLVFAAAGDNDASDGEAGGAHVDLPASMPSIIGCGGTSKTAASETVWQNNPGNADGSGTGGGYSPYYIPLQPWQIGAPNGPGRMVPDVSANADPEVGYEVVIAGRIEIIGGTSAVAPLYAGLFASFGTKKAPSLWTLWKNHLCFNDITCGDNGFFRARVGPDPCTGLGSPVGTSLAKLFAR